jgi:hypothetical protein
MPLSSASGQATLDRGPAVDGSRRCLLQLAERSRQAVEVSAHNTMVGPRRCNAAEAWRLVGAEANAPVRISA